jgi:hypothetical protein
VQHDERRHDEPHSAPIGEAHGAERQHGRRQFGRGDEVDQQVVVGP